MTKKDNKTQVYIQDSHEYSIPFQHPSSHMTGTEIASELDDMSYDIARENYIMKLYLDGHVPSSCRNFFPIKYEFTGPVSGSTRRITFYVSGEYISLGTDADYIRCPLDPITSQVIADKMGCMLPTPKMVDHIWRSDASVKLDPIPWGPPYDSSMMSSERFIMHSRMIDDQLKKKGVDPAGKLIVGHKKDVVVHNILDLNNFNRKKVAIYGWHQSNGKPIQDLYYNNETRTKNPYTGHVNSYKDYSHGIRLVDRNLFVENIDEYDVCVDLPTAMQDPDLWPAFGNEMQTTWRQPNVEQRLGNE
jgi:hypothetical protein